MAKPKNVLDQFKKGAGEAPQYSVLAPGGRPTTAKYVQSFDERAIMVEQPPTIDGGPKGSPKADTLPDVRGYAPKLRMYDGTQNLRADGQVLVRETPTSQKAEKRTKPNYLRVYYDASGEDL